MNSNRLLLGLHKRFVYEQVLGLHYWAVSSRLRARISRVAYLFGLELSDN